MRMLWLSVLRSADFGFELLAMAQNRSFLHLSTSAPRVHGFAIVCDHAACPGAATDEVVLFLINKFEAAQDIRVMLPPRIMGHQWQNTGTRSYRVRSMVDTADHWGTTTLSDSAPCISSTVCDFSLPAVSFSAVVLTKES